MKERKKERKRRRSAKVCPLIKKREPASIDYFATSLPKLLVFKEDLQAAWPPGGRQGLPPYTTYSDDGSWTVKKLTATFTTDDRNDWFIGLSKVEQEKRGTFVIDHLLVEKVK